MSLSFLIRHLKVSAKDNRTFGQGLTRATETYNKMKHLAAYLLLGLAGNTSPSAEDIKGVLSSVGIDADDDRLEKLISELEGKDINAVC